MKCFQPLEINCDSYTSCIQHDTVLIETEVATVMEILFLIGIRNELHVAATLNFIVGFSHTFT